MKLLIASDLHGSSKYIGLLLERIKEEKPDKILYLGDLLYHGPRNDLPEDYDTKKAIDLLNKNTDITIAVRGNCDSEVDQMVLNFDTTSTYTLIEIDGLSIFATHGHIYNASHLPAISNIDVLLHGHTHIPVCENITENKFYMNPGSVSIPKGNSTNSYMIYENRKFTWKDIKGKTYMEKSFN